MSDSLPQFAVCRRSIVPVRRFPDMVSEMTSQARFGEGAEILQSKQGLWQIRLCHDGYEGWVDSRQFTPPQPERPPTATTLTADLTGWAECLDGTTRTERCLLPLGTPLPAFIDGKCRIGPDLWHWHGAVQTLRQSPSWDGFLKTAALYENAPYVWGGRSIWGIDCSGLVQSLLHYQGITITRDCITQVDAGTAVPSFHETRPGDLAFFDGARDGGRHVGIVLENHQILHASAYVRIDELTDRGILVKSTGLLSHHLRALRRLTAWP